MILKNRQLPMMTNVSISKVVHSFTIIYFTNIHLIHKNVLGYGVFVVSLLTFLIMFLPRSRQLVAMGKDQMFDERPGQDGHIQPDFQVNIRPVVPWRKLVKPIRLAMCCRKRHEWTIYILSML